jgi:hypothetical protein
MLLSELDVRNGMVRTKDSSKDDASDQWQTKIKHLREYINTYPADPKNDDRIKEIKELEDKIKGNKE